MLVELGNVAAARYGQDADGKTVKLGAHTDGIPRVTTIHIPDFDDGSTHPDAVYEGPHPHDSEETGTLVKAGPRLGGYTHKPGLSVVDFKLAVADSLLSGQGMTRLPDHEALLAIAFGWPTQSYERPSWVQVTPGEKTDPGVVDDLTGFLQDYFQTDKQRPHDLERTHWTKYGKPGDGPIPGEVVLPDITNLLTNDGRSLYGRNVGGGQVGSIGQATAATSNTLTTNATLVTNAWAGYRVYVTQAAGVVVWGNVISNTNAAGASVLTIDRWYAAATPGGSAGPTPATFTNQGGTYILADGGSTSAWFVGLTTTNITPAATDHAMTGEYVAAGGGFIRKIAPYSLTSGTSPLTQTLIPVFTANGSDTFPSTFFAMNACNSMVVANTTLAQMFETTFTSASIGVVGDQLTLTETETGS